MSALIISAKPILDSSQIFPRTEKSASCSVDNEGVYSPFVACVTCDLLRHYCFLISFFENLERLSHPDYIPTHEDILHARQQTQGVQERKISVNSYNYR